MEGGTLFGVSLTGFGGIALDNEGNIALYYGGGFGGGAGAHATLGVSFQGSNAKTVCDLTGNFTNLSLGAGTGLDATVDAFGGPSDHGLVTGGGLTIGAGLGASAFGGVTNTQMPIVKHQW